LCNHTFEIAAAAAVETTAEGDTYVPDTADTETELSANKKLLNVAVLVNQHTANPEGSVKDTI
jgi:hypothetical protein